MGYLQCDACVLILYNRKYSYKFICRKVQTDCIVYTYICQILPNCLLKFLDVKRALFL